MEARVWHKSYEPNVPATLSYPDEVIPDLLREAVRQWGDRPALLFQNSRLTYGEFADHVERLATALSGMGIRRGSRVAIHAPNLPQTVIAYFATVRLGAIAVMTNPLYTAREIEHQWNDAGATVAIVMDFLYEARVEKIRERLPIEQYIVASIPEYLRFPLNLLAPLKLKRSDPPLIAKVDTGPTVHRFKELIGNTSPSPPNVKVERDDVAMLQYTGGTTGVSKGAMLTHRVVTANVRQCLTWNTQVRPGEETFLACLPFFHIYGLTVSMLTSVASGATMVVTPNPRDIVGIVKSVVKHKVTMAAMVPAMFNGVNQLPGIEQYDLSSIRVCNSGSAPLPVEVLHRFEELTGARISEGYGLTETSPVTHSNPFRGVRKPGSVGVPFPDTDARIVDLETGKTDVPAGTEGELLLQGPQVFPGYWNRPDETDNMLRDGWLYTGDIATMDEDGYFYIVGRKKDMILASGYNVYPDEIDRVLCAHPSILEAATIGLPDKRRGETVKSFVVCKPGGSITEQEVEAYCRENLAAYKVPKQIEFRESLPKSTVLKILRRELRAEELARTEEAAAGT